MSSGRSIIGYFENTSEAIFDATMNVNFKGAFFKIQKFVPIMNNPSSVEERKKCEL